MNTAEGLLPGFADPVIDAQACFSSVLKALSRPGLPQSIDPDVEVPAGLTVEQACVLLTLADYETPVWLAPSVDTAAARDHVAFHCGSPLSDDLGTADFVLVGSERELPPGNELSLGTDTYPDRSATVILAVAGFGEGRTLTGPGIDGTISFDADGLSDRFWTQACVNADLFPRGFDTIFTAPGWIAGLPRSTRIGH